MTQTSGASRGLVREADSVAGLFVDDVTITRGNSRVILGLSLEVPPGRAVAVIGPSGSGKSTLLSAIAGLIGLTSGQIIHRGKVVSTLGRRHRRLWRLRECGFVFQFGDLVPELTLRDNAELPGRLLGLETALVRKTVERLTTAAGLGDVVDQLPSQVSGGQMQRGAVVRALAHGPELVLADEPTGALDQLNSVAVTRMLVDACHANHTTLVVGTHDRSVWQELDEVYEMRDGQLIR